MIFSFLCQLRCMLILASLLVCNLISAGTLYTMNVGTTQLTLKLSDNTVAEVLLHQITIGDNYLYKNALLWGGDIGQLPKVVLISVNVQVNNEQIFVPLFAYSDLGEIKTASLEKALGGFNLLLHGGNTATSYDAVLTFKQGYLHSKKVALREFPNQRWEKIIYSFTKN